MANFRPLKNYMFYCLDRSIGRYGLSGPFLDVGCGCGDLSVHLARKGWTGKAIDVSDEALLEARRNLAPHPKVQIEKLPLAQTEGRFGTVFLWDVLEHIQDDHAALRKTSTLVRPGGHLHLSVPSNPREWRWDDDYYGHYRRYTEENLRKELNDAGFSVIAIWDFTYPVFWLLRRCYTRLKKPQKQELNIEERTKASSRRNAWDMRLISSLLDGTAFLWHPLFLMQFSLFRSCIRRGHELFVIARMR